MPLCFASTLESHAVLITGTPLVVINGSTDVILTFEGSDAGYTDILWTTSPSLVGPIFNNHMTAVGQTWNLGQFAAGTEIIFAVNVLNTGNWWYSGPGTRNADGVEHFGVFTELSTATDLFVGVEDLYGGGDRDYNDVQFTFSNLAAETPDMAYTLPLLALGLACIVLLHRHLPTLETSKS